ncbi:protease [Tumebacillus algifaecis]|uniref:Protease n=1 Tax=Tumebacillus algifaecis TaxID=1214604 RepID=A0A223D3H8_9BACL|nr:protease [Tumebacillus algifaecis]ASS76055.1 protease [Tumebacillus algifaecis]
MLELYYGCLIGGVLFAVCVVIFGDLFHIHGPDFLDPTVIVGWVTAFGGSGVLLSTYTSLDTGTIVMMAAMVGIVLSFLLYFFYVKPMKKSENSTGFSVRDLEGKIGEVSVAIPEQGFGEVIVKVGAGNTNQIAASFDRENISTGNKVVVVEVKEDVLYVSRYDLSN